MTKGILELKYYIIKINSYYKRMNLSRLKNLNKYSFI